MWRPFTVAQHLHVRYGTGGTPWSVVIDKSGIVRFSDFTPDSAQVLAGLIERFRTR